MVEDVGVSTGKTAKIAVTLVVESLWSEGLSWMVLRVSLVEDRQFASVPSKSLCNPWVTRV